MTSAGSVLTVMAHADDAELWASGTLGRLHGGRIGVGYAEAFSPVPILGHLPITAHL